MFSIWTGGEGRGEGRGGEGRGGEEGEGQKGWIVKAHRHTHLQITVNNWLCPMVQPRHSQQHVSENPQHLMLREPSVQSGVHHLQDGAAVIELHHNEDLVNIVTLAADGPVVEGD